MRERYGIPQPRGTSSVLALEAGAETYGAKVHFSDVAIVGDERDGVRAYHCEIGGI